MVSIIVYKNQKNDITGFDCKGHAGYSEYGSDIVCAALSMLIINTINAIETFTDCNMSIDSETHSGTIQVRFLLHEQENLSQEVVLLLNTMILGIEQVCESYNTKKKVYAKIEYKQT